MAVDPRTGRINARATGAGVTAAAAAAAAAAAPVVPAAAPPVIQHVTVSMMDTFIPTIPEVSAEALAARFKTSSFKRLMDLLRVRTWMTFAMKSIATA